MDNSSQRNLLNWAYFCQGKTIEELRNSLLYTTLELEQTRITAQDELRKKNGQLIQLRDLLSQVIKQKDEVQEKYQKLLLEEQKQKQQTTPILSGVSSNIEDEPPPIRGIESSNGFSSSDCEGSIVSSPVFDSFPQRQSSQPSDIEFISDKPLPEKGKLLQTVMKAGPLLQNLLLAGPLPKWKHPPPPLDSFDIPPVTIAFPQQILRHDSLITTNTNGSNICNVNRKRGFCDGIDPPTRSKFQRMHNQ